MVTTLLAVKSHRIKGRWGAPVNSPRSDLSAPRAAILIGAGIVSAAHVGKAVIALPALTAELPPWSPV